VWKIAAAFKFVKPLIAINPVPFLVQLVMTDLRGLSRGLASPISPHLATHFAILAIPMAMDVTTWMDAEVQITPADLFRALPVDPKDDGYSQSHIGHFEYVANVVIYAHRWLKRAHSLDEVRARPTAL
jgi:hypothetical protein